MLDLEQHLKRQIAFSRATFGPGERRKGVIDHIRKELIEVEQSDGSADEWVDVVILALDGLTRRIVSTLHSHYYSDAARRAVAMIEGKQNRNELRDWPDWRTAPADKAIGHVKTPFLPFVSQMPKFVGDKVVEVYERRRDAVAPRNCAITVESYEKILAEVAQEVGLTVFQVKTHLESP